METAVAPVAPEQSELHFSDLNCAKEDVSDDIVHEGNGHSPVAENEIEDEGDIEEDEIEEKESKANLHTSEQKSSESHGKRVRKQVQRLSETLSKAHEQEVEKRAKAAKQVIEIFQGAKGTELGAIPLIEDSIRKTKPVNLKPLHLIIFGRLGAANEVRSNLRKFKGFGFGPDSAEYSKKVSSIQQRPMNEVREVLRLLHLEVSGTREVMATRLMEFLVKPVADKVKYKGKLVKKSGKGRGTTPSGKKRGRPSSGSSKVSSSHDASSENVSHTGDEDDDEDDDNASENVSSLESEESEDEKPAKKRAKPQQRQKKENGVKRPVKKRVVTHESESEDEGTKSSNGVAGSVESEEDVPLANLTSQKKSAFPTDGELKNSIIDLLKTVDLEQTSLKVVREQIFARFPDVDLNSKKEFINSTVKQYLAQV